MSAQDIITAYPNAVPTDKNINLEYTKVEVWDDNGKPSLVEYAGSGKLKGKTALITGGSSGIGRAAAILFAREGARGITIVHLSQENNDAQVAKDAIEGAGAQVLTLAVDLTDEQNCKSVVDEHIKKFGSLNILVNNVAKQTICRDLQDIDLASVRSTFETNTFQLFALAKFAIPHLKRGASIINATSLSAFTGSPKLVDYSASKGAVVAFTRSLAKQLAPKGIRVNAVAPGPVITGTQTSSRSEEEVEGLGLGMPLHGRAAQPVELGPTYVYLASSDSNVMTGAVIHINSGQFIGGA